MKKKYTTMAFMTLVALVFSMSAMASDNEDAVLVESSLKPGAKAPMFELPDAQGNTVKLAEILKDGPALVFFYRGAWCPFCTKAHEKMAAALPKFKELGVTVVAISPQVQKYTAATAEKNDLPYLTLSDVGLNVAKKFGLDFKIDDKTKDIYLNQYGLDVGEYNGEGGWQLPVPGYYLINTDGTIVWAYANPDYKVRPEPEQILAEVKKLGTTM